MLKKHRVHLQEETGDMSSVVERQAWACSGATTVKSCLATLNCCTCSSPAPRTTSLEGSCHPFFLTVGRFPPVAAPSPLPFIQSAASSFSQWHNKFLLQGYVATLPIPGAQGKTQLSFGSREISPSVYVFRHSKNSYHLLNTYYVLCNFLHYLTSFSHQACKLL